AYLIKMGGGGGRQSLHCFIAEHGMAFPPGELRRSRPVAQVAEGGIRNQPVFTLREELFVAFGSECLLFSEPVQLPDGLVLEQHHGLVVQLSWLIKLLFFPPPLPYQVVM